MVRPAVTFRGVIAVVLLLALIGAVAAAARNDRPPKPKFKATRSYLVGLDPTDIATADFNADGKLDVATTNFASSGGTVSLGSWPARARASWRRQCRSRRPFRPTASKP